jgi:Zn-dependent protease with chaperone function
MRRITFGFLVILLVALPAFGGKKKKQVTVEQMQLPADYAIDLQLAISSRLGMMNGATEIIGTPENEVGDQVFNDLVKAGFSQPYPWKLTLVNNEVVNASSTAGGQIYVYGGMLKVLPRSPGFWAAVMSHEIAHTGLRHQVRTYLQRMYNQEMINYYRARAQAGDNSANWALVGFSIAASLTLKNMEREQEHTADQTGMMLMARAGYHPDYVFALHHLLRLRIGEQSKFGAFFSDHPRWETRDQRSERVYAEALEEYNRRWPQPELSPGGAAPAVVFLGQITSLENKGSHAAEISVPLFCRNEPGPVNLNVVFFKNNHPIKTGSTQADVLHYTTSVQCPQQEAATPVVIHVPSDTITGKDRKLDARLTITHAEGNLLEASKPFKIVFPK